MPEANVHLTRCLSPPLSSALPHPPTLFYGFLLAGVRPWGSEVTWVGVGRGLKGMRLPRLAAGNKTRGILFFCRSSKEGRAELDSRRVPLSLGLIRAMPKMSSDKRARWAVGPGECSCFPPLMKRSERRHSLIYDDEWHERIQVPFGKSAPHKHRRWTTTFHKTLSKFPPCPVST